MPHPIVRFAPSPTGAIHIGNARTALLNFLHSKKHHGEFILRFDDTDAERSKEEYAQAIEVDLAWLGIVPDRVLRQSQRIALYEAAAKKLRAAGRLYACYETAEELERKRRRQQARGQPPVYDRAALALSAEDRARLEAEGRRPHWRFLLERRIVRWDDLIRGESHIDSASLSDPVLIREDGTFLYTLPSVVDDLDCKVTAIIRGEDHVTNTAVQIELFEALAGAGSAPGFGHHNLLSSVSGEGLSKRTGALSIGGLRDAGLESLAVAAAAVLIGSSIPLHPVVSLAELTAILDFRQLSRTQTRFDPAELAALSARTLHGLGFEAVRDRLGAHEIVGYKAEPFWLAVRGNLSVFLDVVDWWRVVEGEIALPARDSSDEAFLKEAAAALPPEPFDETTWSVWINVLKERTGRKGRALFHPLRLALTGQENGPELAALMPLIGRVRASARLCGRAA
ncbi:glutamate--tRNA ligase [Methylocella silvestris]|uniref:Glutamate--tRNA ligase n=1 Tax=Methylocella silvestris TaxID=199596 RepID=A0A2J7TKN6_METSI|nr:glutamate--tRNA ligase [Methylocella silvestris]PNG27287.1 glutamate--tRNA ligase [Methylocella silvestris]